MKVLLVIVLLIVILMMLSDNKEGMTDLSDDMAALRRFKNEPYPAINSTKKLKDLELKMKDSEDLSEIIKKYNNNDDAKKITPTLTLNEAIDKLQYIKDNEPSE